MRNQALRADLLMLTTAFIWGSAFVAQRMGMDSIGPYLYSGLRFALGTLVLLPVVYVLSRGNKQPFNRGLFIGGGLMGLVLALGIN
ncbi:EamA family transporter, partial [Pseudomonas viridiflava]|uniref:EamA family transporter n=1 Tax=Pseudomonas viridiflava TaxID=33069 RepID=UPI0013E09202